jgi:hypothetical protein
VGEGRIATIREAINQLAKEPSGDAVIRYLCPWPTAEVQPGSVDLIVTQAVLQDIDHWAEPDVLDSAFGAMSRWLKAGGVMSHQVNLAFPETEQWNRHWGYRELTWRLIRGRRPYFVNRVPASEYLRLCEKHGFEVVACTLVPDADGVPPSALPKRFRGLPATDYTTRAIHLVAVKR